MKCIACHQKIKISQVVISAPIGDVCRECVKDGWEIYETGSGLALRRRPVKAQGAVIQQTKASIQMAMEF